MVTQSIFNISPYYDDFDESKNFLRMLFRPGYAVQARELTQAQTILQNQVDRFGSHMFEDGSKVLGAALQLVLFPFCVFIHHMSSTERPDQQTSIN